jgi:hypothetical protein
VVSGPTARVKQQREDVRAGTEPSTRDRLQVAWRFRSLGDNSPLCFFFFFFLDGRVQHKLIQFVIQIRASPDISEIYIYISDAGTPEAAIPDACSKPARRGQLFSTTVDGIIRPSPALDGAAVLFAAPIRLAVTIVPRNWFAGSLATSSRGP